MPNKVVYYIVHPNGREKIGENITVEKALELFNVHWTVSANWVVDKGKRKLIKTETTTVCEEEI